MIDKVEVPKESVVYEYISDIDYSDAYKMALRDTSVSAEEIYIHIFSHIPSWVMPLMRVRNKIVSLFGLKTDDSVGHKKVLTVGEKAGMFLIYRIEEEEIIAGEDNVHLDFRVSVLKRDGEVTISTLVHYNNLFGKVYMSIITPFHKMVVKAMMKNALKRERIRKVI